MWMAAAFGPAPWGEPTRDPMLPCSCSCGIRLEASMQLLTICLEASLRRALASDKREGQQRELSATIFVMGTIPQ